MAKGWEIAGITPDQPLDERARLIIVSKFREAFHFCNAVRISEDADTIHDMRVSLRRLWAAMSGFSDCFSQYPKFSRLARRTRKLSSRLGKVRDLDVLIELLQTRAQHGSLSEAAAAAIDHIVAFCLKQRFKRRTKLLQYLEKLTESQFEDKFLRFFEQPNQVEQPDQTGDTQSAMPNIFFAALENFYTHEPHDDYRNAEMLHQLRIAAKKLRYSLEFYEICYRRQLTSYLKSMRLLQELLGDIHDCDVMAEFLSKRQAKLTIRETPALIMAGLSELIDNFQQQRAELAEKFIALWQQRFQRVFKARLTKILNQV